MEGSDNVDRFHIGRNGRRFVRHVPSVCYDIPESQRQALTPAILKRINDLPTDKRERLVETEIPARTARAWQVPAGCIWRIEIIQGPQVADINVWNANNPRERFYSSKTRQLHASHVTTGDSLWSCMPYIRPLATIVADSLDYGIDEDNAGVHDVIGSRCDPYTHAVMTGEIRDDRCHSNLTRAALSTGLGLGECDVHDVFNVFMCTGFERRTGRYFSKPSPAVEGDYLELFAQIDLIIAAGTCPQGDVSLACGSDAEPVCYPLMVTIYRLPDGLLRGWTPPCISPYRGMHGLVHQPGS